MYIVAQKFGLLLQFFEVLPQENNRPMGENSPNLVTLLLASYFFYTPGVVTHNLGSCSLYTLQMCIPWYLFKFIVLLKTGLLCLRFNSWSHSYNRELQAQRCKSLRRQE
jgi:hypothetical protein